LQLYLGLDGFVGEGNGGYHLFFAHLVHLALYHGYRVAGGAHDEVHVGAGQVTGFGVNLELTVDTGYAHFRNRAGKRNV
jgi:hypothetical protein